MTTTDEKIEPKDTSSGLAHPGFEWLSSGACCAGGDESGGMERLTPYFVDAGRVIGASVQSICKTKCPVRRECIIHAYLGGPEGTMIGAGYFGGFSLGERRSMTLAEALGRAEPGSPLKHRRPRGSR